MIEKPQPKGYSLSTLSKKKTGLFYTIVIVATLALWSGLERIFSLEAEDAFGNLRLWDNSWPWLLTLLAATITMIVLHEGLHGLTLKLYGKRVRFGAILKQGRWMMPAFYTTSPDTITRAQYQTLCLAPQALTVLGVFLLAFAPLPKILSYGLLTLAVINFGGSAGDLYFTYLLGRYPKDTMFKDTKDGFRIVKK
jgi:hypothetical protein